MSPDALSVQRWQKLYRQAASDHLELFRTVSGLTIYATIGIRVPLVTITIDQLDDEDAEKVLRQLTEKALDLLKGLER